MNGELNGRRIIVPETRELALLTRMLEERGAICVACPMVAIRDAPDAAPVEAWLRRFIAAPADDVVLLTGEGLRRLVALADRLAFRDSFVAALRQARFVTRGPKPVRALREIGLDSTISADPPTTAGVIAALEKLDLKDRRVAVQLYPDKTHDALLGALERAGAAIDPILPYVYASRAEEAQVIAAIEEMAAGRIDAIAFTSGPQVRRLSEVAEKNDCTAKLREGLSRVMVAAVGPVVAAELQAFGRSPDVSPAGETYFMKPLVRALAEALRPKSFHI
jgi:uroporphyrinogen-III synthase